MTRHKGHRFIGELPSLEDPGFVETVERMLGHQQVTDGYLVALAHHHEIQLVTFDRRIEALARNHQTVLRLTP